MTDTPKRPVRVFLVDDHGLFRAGVRAELVALGDRIEIVGEAEDAEEAIQAVAYRRPDVVLLDFDMPAGGGVRAATEIKDAHPGTRIVALSADASPEAQVGMARAGAVGYLLKGAADDEIVRTIRSAFRW